MLTLEHIQTGFILPGGQKKILASDLNFSAREGELTAVVGPNGVGKSTLLHTIMRFHMPLRGNIIIENRDITSFTAREFALQCSFVPAGKIPVSRLTVEEVISFARYPHTGWFGKLADRDLQAVNESIEALRLQQLRNRYIDELSDGELQRTWIARALAQDTGIVVMDEPTAFLDIPNRFEIYRFLKDIAETQNRLILFASHDLEFVLGTADKIWLLLSDEGVEGAPEDLLASGTFNRLFGDTGITFHPEKGLRFPFPGPGRNYFLSGNETLCRWIKKALNRTGFQASRDPDKAHSGRIMCSKKKITLIKKGQEIRFSTVYALILFLKMNNDH